LGGSTAIPKDPSKDAIKVKGISTDTFQISPYVAWKYDREGMWLWLGLAGAFFVCGVILILAGIYGTKSEVP
jgi:hypothetical protein